jgi:hypothetical protein
MIRAFSCAHLPEKDGATNKFVPPRSGTATALLAVMIAALLFIAILDIGPLLSGN